MSKRDRDVAHLYHESTKLFYLDLQRKPPAYKRYRALLPLPLPTEVSPLAVPYPGGRGRHCAGGQLSPGL